MLNFIFYWATSIVAVALTFGLVIIIHEYGHFLLCRLLKIRVETFAFGFGPEIWSRTVNGTKYVVRWILLGGYVKPAGEALDEAKGAPDEYFSKPWYARIAVHLAGPAMNYVLAFALFTGVIYFGGTPVPSSDPVIGELTESYPASLAGLKEGDRITAVDGEKITTWTQMARTIHSKPAIPIKISYERDGKTADATLVPRTDSTGKFGLIGILPGVVYKNIGVFKSVGLGAYQCYYWTEFTVVTLASKIHQRERPDLAGPVGIVHMVSKAAHTGFANFLFLVALISVAVGFFNLLPVPVLDGGQSLLFLWEGISRRKLTEKVFQVANSIGLAFLVCVIVFATYSDIVRIAGSSRSKPAAADTSKK